MKGNKIEEEGRKIIFFFVLYLRQDLWMFLLNVESWDIFADAVVSFFYLHDSEYTWIIYKKKEMYVNGGGGGVREFFFFAQ